MPYSEQICLPVYRPHPLRTLEQSEKCLVCLAEACSTIENYGDIQRALLLYLSFPNAKRELVETALKSVAQPGMGVLKLMGLSENHNSLDIDKLNMEAEIDGDLQVAEEECIKAKSSQITQLLLPALLPLCYALLSHHKPITAKAKLAKYVNQQRLTDSVELAIVAALLCYVLGDTDGFVLHVSGLASLGSTQFQPVLHTQGVAVLSSLKHLTCNFKHRLALGCLESVFSSKSFEDELELEGLVRYIGRADDFVLLYVVLSIATSTRKESLDILRRDNPVSKLLATPLSALHLLHLLRECQLPALLVEMETALTFLSFRFPLLSVPINESLSAISRIESALRYNVLSITLRGLRSVSVAELTAITGLPAQPSDVEIVTVAEPLGFRFDPFNNLLIRSDPYACIDDRISLVTDKYASVVAGAGLAADLTRRRSRKSPPLRTRDDNRFNDGVSS
ncbi:MAG: hypothetical protein KVP17_001009 [Porospora cf. gigantea B]|uniref:uncharacterized protein n=2 Tax=Porospora cf. gigantea B TaxID=2853592 RepID=UPI003571C632|nr:MAG: hypothetical protein KVP17_001009 [Porospora cf. gigantea B]